jgi:hypothetical protein
MMKTGVDAQGYHVKALNLIAKGSKRITNYQLGMQLAE